VLQAGILVNAFGNGAANPFLLLYFHEVRGIPLAVAGLASAVAAATALGAALASGPLADRFGGRATLALGLLLSTSAFALYPLVREGWQAVALAALGGSGVGTWLTGQSALLATLVSPEQRPLAFAQQRVFANVGLGLGGAVGGLLVTTSNPETFTTLFLLNAATFVAFGLFVTRVPDSQRRPRGETAGSYGLALRDRPFVGLLAVNYLYVAAAVALLVGLFPVYAKQEADLSEDAIGLLFLFNSLLIIGAQVRVASSQGGKRRMRALALMGLLFACSWALVLAGGLVGGGLVALALLTTAIAVFSFGECLYDTVQGPLTADLAPEGSTGRYMALSGFSWQLGFITGPAIGAVILGAAPHALWIVAAVACCVAAVASLHLERRLPDRVRRTPVVRAAPTGAPRRRRAATSSR